MMIYKVAPRGEGKTKWLVEQAKNELDRGETVVLLTPERRRSDVAERSFFEHYFAAFQEICRVTVANHIQQIPENSVVLIDNLMALDMHINAIAFVAEKVKRMYITLDGTTAVKLPDIPDPDQISIFDIMSEGS